MSIRRIEQPAPTAPPLPLLAGDDLSRPLVWRAGQAISAGRFLALVEAVATELGGARHTINLCEDRFHFLIGFAAAALRGKTSLLPSSRAPRVIEEVADQHGGAFCFDDDFVAARLDRVTREATRVPTIAADAVVAIGFTSGSTGHPRPHLKRWASFQASNALNAGVIRARLAARGLDGEPCVIATVPPQHMYGMETSVLLPLIGDMAVHAGRPLFPGDVAAALADVPAPRVLVSTPVHLRALVDSGVRFPDVALVLSATAPLEPRLAAEVERVLATEVRELFGSTETCVIAHRRTAIEPAWTLYPSVSLTPEPDGTRVAAPWFAEVTPLQDVVELTPEGFLLRGRHVDMIEIAGKRASLTDLTRRLAAIEGVSDAVVFQPDGEGPVRRVAALVVSRARTAEQIADDLRGMIDPAFLPRPLLCVPELPRNEVGKLTRACLLDALRRLERND